MPMISPDMQTTSLLAKTARLLDSVAEAAWTNGIPAPLKWDLHRIGTDAYLAQRDILDALGQGAMPVDPLPVVDIAAALEEAAQSLAAISQAGHNVATKRLEQRVASLARRALALTPVGTAWDVFTVTDIVQRRRADDEFGKVRWYEASEFGILLDCGSTALVCQYALLIRKAALERFTLAVVDRLAQQMSVTEEPTEVIGRAVAELQRIARDFGAL